MTYTADEVLKFIHVFLDKYEGAGPEDAWEDVEGLLEMDEGRDHSVVHKAAEETRNCFRPSASA